MPSSTLTIITGNPGKATEIERILGIPTQLVDFDLPEIQSMDARAVATAKAEAAFHIIKKTLLVDDTSLFIPALGGLPGPFVSWFMSSVGGEGLLNMLHNTTDRRAKVCCCLGYADAQGQIHTFLGEVEGTLSVTPQGESGKGLGFDSIFIPQGDTRTFATMTGAEKDHYSHRRLALDMFKQFMNTQP